MKISLDWLREYVDFEESALEVAEILSDMGFPCEGIEHFGDDTVIDVEVTSNRGDCLGHIGVARELAAATGRILKLPAVTLDESQTDVSEKVSVEIRDPDLCGRYTARLIEGVKAGLSPDWVVRRLEAVGMRSVNNIVDATNYAMLETGQPPHAFDMAKIKDGRIIVRRAAAGERIVSIDGSQCDLDPEMLVIADPDGPVAIAGVMGGLHTEVSDATTSILLEDADFDPVSVRTTSRRLGLASEAAYRFERIVDRENIDWASKRTAQLIMTLAGGKVVPGVVDAYPRRWEPKEVSLRLGRLRKLLGIEIPAEQVVEILKGLSLEPVLNGDAVDCKTPSWRSDIYREADLIEEVARVYGYNKVPTECKIEIEVVPPDPRQKLLEVIGSSLNAYGFYETINVTFCDKTAAKTFGNTDVESHLGVRDERRKHANLLRQSLIGSLLGVLRTNVNAKNLPCRVFEIADTFVPVGQSELPEERTKLAMVCDSDFRGLRGAVESLIEAMDARSEVDFSPAELSWTDTGAAITAGDTRIGVAGIVAASVKSEFELKDLEPVAAELDLEAIAALQGGPVKVSPIPRFPAVQRDLSVVVDEQVAWAQIAKAVESAAPEELERLEFVDIYRGKGVPSGSKSVTLAIRFRDMDGTLTHETVDGFQDAIVNKLSEEVSAQLRTI